MTSTAVNVGVGTTNPANALDVLGTKPTLRIRANAAAYSGGTASLLFDTTELNFPLGKIMCLDATTVAGDAYKGDMAFYTQFNTTLYERMRITNLGNVGIGTANPNALLHAHGSGYPAVLVSDSAGSVTLMRDQPNNVNILRSYGGRIDIEVPANYKRMTFADNTGYVGIGTTNPMVPFHVNTTVGINMGSGMSAAGVPNGGNGYYFNYVTSISSWPYTSGANVSIFARGAIACADNVIAASDERVKKNIQPVQEVLDKIRRLDVVSYDRIDFREKGVDVGVVARNIRGILPKAVHATRYTIPNIYLPATHLKIRTGVLVEVKCDDKDIKEGSSVKLMIMQGDKEIEHVSNMTNWTGSSFEVEEWKEYSEEDKVFAYGVEVDDFLNVDKDQIGILAAGAVKELDGIVAEQSREISELKRLVRSFLG